MGTFDDFFFATDVSLAQGDTAFETSAGPDRLPTHRFGVVAYGNAGGVVGCGGQAITRILGPHSSFAGVHGTAQDFTGVAGTSRTRIGVYGQVEDNFTVPTFLHGGVVGTAGTQFGVLGFSQDGEGVVGTSFSRTGVSGESIMWPGVGARSNQSPGVIAISNEASGVVAVSGLAGPQVPNTSNIAGVVGSSDQQHGVIGTSNASVGVIGFSNNIGVLGYTTTPGALAGQFIGNIQVIGTKAAVVPFPDGTHRALYCMESPDLWFEDFGTAKLRRGRAVIKIDANFAKVIKRGDYRVFVTPEGDCRGLYVRGKRAASFEVRELMGGTSSIAFSYRIVGRRKDIRGHRRFPKFDMPVPPTPAPRARGPAPTREEFIAELERRARAKATRAMRKSDREVAAMPPAVLDPRDQRARRRAPG